jgi:Recombination endonuclease VII
MEPDALRQAGPTGGGGLNAALVQYNAPRVPTGANCENCTKTKGLGRDHCHTHDWIRAIVCAGCNSGLRHLTLCLACIYAVYDQELPLTARSAA